MRLSYFAQIINLVCSLALLALVLAKLPPGFYLQWIIFTTIAGLFIQLETSLSIVGSRSISRSFHAASFQSLASSLAYIRRIYHSYGWLVLVVMLVAGGAYLSIADAGQFSPDWPIEWLIFALGYLVTFYPAANCCLLLALDRPTTYSAITLFSRVLNVMLSLTLVWFGLATLGLTISFLVSATICAALFVWFSKQVLNETMDALPTSDGGQETVAQHDAQVSQVALHATFVLASYGLYRVGLLLDVGLSTNVSAQASFGLAVQVFSLLVTIAIVPITMRIGPLVSAVGSKNRGRIAAEAAMLSVPVNLVFLAGAVAFIVLGPFCLGLIDAKGAELPSTFSLILLAAAFWLEANLMVLVNLLVAARGFAFAPVYGGVCVLAWAMGAMFWAVGAPFMVAFVAWPLLCQACLTTPLLLRLVRRQTDLTLSDYLLAFGRRAIRIVRNPIAAGLRFAE